MSADTSLTQQSSRRRRPLDRLKEAKKSLCVLGLFATGSLSYVGSQAASRDASLVEPWCHGLPSALLACTVATLLLIRFRVYRVSYSIPSWRLQCSMANPVLTFAIIFLHLADGVWECNVIL